MRVSLRLKIEIMRAKSKIDLEFHRDDDGIPFSWAGWLEVMVVTHPGCPLTPSRDPLVGPSPAAIIINKILI